MEYKIFHGPNTVHFIECAPGSAVESGQPYQETFDNEAASIARVLQLDENFFPAWNRDDYYLPGIRVKFGSCIFRSLQENEARDFELPDLELDPDAEIATPENRQARWKMVCNPEFEELTNEEESY